MGRMHSSGKGLSSSALPYKRSPPSWLKISSSEVWKAYAPACNHGSDQANHSERIDCMQLDFSHAVLALLMSCAAALAAPADGCRFRSTSASWLRRA